MEGSEVLLFTGPKRFHATFEIGGANVEVEVQTPDLTGRSPSVWGDWGPMYTFEFDEPRFVRISYCCEGLSAEGEIDLPIEKMQLDSPMSYARRQEHPLFLHFQDPTRGLEFEGYLDGQGEPAHLDVKRMSRGDVVSLLVSRMPTDGGWQPAAVERRVA